MPSERLVTLERFAYTPMGTFGRLRVVGNAPFYTIELPWNNNEPRRSCIPCGTYPLVLGMFYGGDGVGGKRDYPAYEIKEVPGRDLIKIHIGNTVEDIDGCVAPGLSLSYSKKKGLWAVGDSILAHNTFMAEMGEQPGRITISNYIGGVL